MKYMNIGHSDVKASIITLGAWSIGGGSWWKNTEDELSIKTIHRALELGINTIDTAPIYGLGHSEEIVGKAISGNRDEFARNGAHAIRHGIRRQYGPRPRGGQKAQFRHVHHVSSFPFTPCKKTMHFTHPHERRQ